MTDPHDPAALDPSFDDRITARIIAGNCLDLQFCSGACIPCRRTAAIAGALHSQRRAGEVRGQTFERKRCVEIARRLSQEETWSDYTEEVRHSAKLVGLRIAGLIKEGK